MTQSAHVFVKVEEYKEILDVLDMIELLRQMILLKLEQKHNI